MPYDYREVALAARKALTLVPDPERRRILEEFIEGTAPLVESAARESVQRLVEEINAQLAPQCRVRLIQEGTRLVPEVVPLGEPPLRGPFHTAGDAPISKLLVRMPANIKEQATESARRAGLSLNSWTVTMLERALDNLRRYQPPPEEPHDSADHPPDVSDQAAPGDSPTTDQSRDPKD